MIEFHIVFYMNEFHISFQYVIFHSKNKYYLILKGMKENRSVGRFNFNVAISYIFSIKYKARPGFAILEISQNMATKDII